ncbi:MAG: RpiB/LacA/LacB family sugar-phosphate isomerase [Minisyncoccia bacterium]|jgi:ribose 5-phosphate isomerase B
MLYLGADHRGYYLKEAIKKYLISQKIQFEDLGNLKYEENDDYPDFAQLVAKKVQEHPFKDYGILICGSGIGMTIVANKYSKIRAGLCLSSFMAQKAREDDGINILCLSGDLTDEATAIRIVKTFLTTKFSNDKRYKRRIQKITKIERILK